MKARLIILLGFVLILFTTCELFEELLPDDEEESPTFITLSEWQEQRFLLEAFALEFYNEVTGEADSLQWITDPGLLEGFLESIQAEATPPVGDTSVTNGLTESLTQPIFLRLPDSNVLRLDVAYVEDNEQVGTVIFADGLGKSEPFLYDIITSAYQLEIYSSSENKKKKLQGTQPSSSFNEEALIAEPTKTGDLKPSDLVVYQDNQGQVHNKKIAEKNKQKNGATIVEAKGVNSIINQMRRMKRDCKCVKNLIISVHGNAGFFRLGPNNVGNKVSVGFYGNMVSPTDFGNKIKPYLCENATIQLLSCTTASNGGTAATNGPKALQDLANASGATVTASDQTVSISIRYNKPTCNVFKGEASTQGNLYKATPNQNAPAVDKAKPAGNIHC